MRTLKYYVENTTQTMNGVVYKNEDAFNNHSDEPCYISEYAIETIANALENGINMTIERLIEDGDIDTYKTILGKVADRWEELMEIEELQDYTKEQIAEQVFNESDWSYIDTTIDQLTY